MSKLIGLTAIAILAGRSAMAVKQVTRPAKSATVEAADALAPLRVVPFARTKREFCPPIATAPQAMPDREGATQCL